MFSKINVAWQSSINLGNSLPIGHMHSIKKIESILLNAFFFFSLLDILTMWVEPSNKRETA